MADIQASKPGLWKRYKRLVLGLAFISMSAFVALQVSIPDCATIQAKIQALGYLAPIAFFLLYVLATIAFIPGLIVTLMAGLAFGAWWGTLIVSISSTVGATLAFLIARYLARDAVEKFLSKQSWFGKFREGVEENGFNFVIFARVVPIFPFNGLNYACGLTPLSIRNYVLGSMIGMLPGTFAYVYLGESVGCTMIDAVIQRHFSFADMPAEIRTKLLIALSLLAVLSILPILLKKLKKSKSHPNP